MKSISVISGQNKNEREFSRMIELSLFDRGYTVLQEADSASSLWVFVFDVLDQSRLSVIDQAVAGGGEHSVICCARELEEDLPAEVIYLKRPFDIRRFLELIASLMGGKSIGDHEVMQDPDLLILNREKKCAIFGSEIIHLSEREFALLELLDSKRSKVVSKEEAVAHIWGKDAAQSSNSLEVYIRYLREKLDDRFQKRFIFTVRGKGYMLK